MSLLLDKAFVVSAASSSGTVDMKIVGIGSLGFNPLNLQNKQQTNFVDQIGSESVGINLNKVCVDNLVGSTANFSGNSNNPPRVNNELEDFNLLGLPRPFLNPNLVELKQFSNQSRPGSILNISPLDYKKLADGQVLRYLSPRSTKFMSIRVKSLKNNPVPRLEVQESQSSSSTVPEMSEYVSNKLTHSHQGQFVNTCPVTAFQPNPVPLVSRRSSIGLVTSTGLPEPHYSLKELGTSSGLGVSRLVRRLSFVPVSDRGVGRRQSGDLLDESLQAEFNQLLT